MRKAPPVGGALRSELESGDRLHLFDDLSDLLPI
jgi:hypothetical protein